MVKTQATNKEESLTLARDLWRDYPDVISIYFLDYPDLNNWIVGTDDMAELFDNIKL